MSPLPFNSLNSSMNKRIALLLVAVLAAAIGLSSSSCRPPAGGPGAHDARRATQKYHCPMHPTYVADKPGDCPICNMKLVPIKADEPAAPAAGPSTAPAPDDKIAQVNPGQFYCPMGAEHIQDKPGKCPICNMNLVEKKEPQMDQEAEPTSMTDTPASGRISISLSPDKRQMIGLTLARVERRALERTVRATAVVTHDETRYARIAPRFGGWVRKLHVNFTGAPVQKGQPLFTVYSPELFASENEYLIAWRGLQALTADASEEQRRIGAELLSASRRRLELGEIGDDEIRALEQRRAPSDQVLFRSPVEGYVVAKTAVEGRFFMAGESLFEVADLSHLWIDAWIFESDMPVMKPGLQGTITFPSLGNRSFTTPITFLYPQIDSQTRRGRVRLELDNPDQLRPDLWASVDFQVPLGEKVLIPASAVMDTGRRFLAFVDGQDGHLEPRELKVGIRTDDDYEVLAGVKEGENVVTRALFLVDSESQLKAAIAGMAGDGGHED